MDAATWRKLKWPLVIAAPVLMLVLLLASGQPLSWENMFVVLIAPLLVLMGIEMRLSRERAPPAFGMDARSLPVAEWAEESRRAGTVDYKAKVTRRCRIEPGPDGGPLFVHEAVSNETGKFWPVTMLLGAGGMQLAEKAMQARGIGFRENAFVAPWTALSSFVLTTDAEHYGLHTNAGGPLRANQINHMVMADFGVEWGSVVVSECNAGKAFAMELHRRLTRDFVLSRPRHLDALRAVHVSGGTVDGGQGKPSARPASRPSEL